MRVEQLELKGFRNIRESTFVPSPGLNFLVGPNGQGKTSYLEAIAYLATLRSFRGSKTPEVIQWGQEAAEVRCTLKSDDSDDAWRTDLRITFRITDPTRTRASKVAHINEKPYRSSTQFLSQRFGSFELGFHAVVFNTSDHDLVRGDPATRRSFLDRVLAAEDIEYLKVLQRYQKLLEQRNALLKTGQGNSQVLAGFSEPFAQYAAVLAAKRLAWIQRAIPSISNVADQIAPGQPSLKLVYASNWVPPIEGLSINNHNLGAVHFAGQGDLPSVELLEQAFWRQLSALESAEWRAGHSLVGTHRDDWAFFLGNQALKGHGSQGEVRSALLSLKLSEIKLFQNATGHRPVFLLDDFSSELDRDRRSFLLRFLTGSDLQVFVSTTEDSVFSGKRYWVLNGGLSEEGINGHGTAGPIHQR
jgi:DNA replication and repair protein RecF